MRILQIKNRIKGTVYFIVLHAFFLVNLTSQTITIKPTEDSYTRGGEYKNTNYGNETELIVKKSSNESFARKSFVKYDLSTINLQNADSIVLQFYVTDITGNMSIALYECSDNWQESNLTWSTNPLPGKEIYIRNLDASLIGTHLTFDVTSYIFSRALSNGIVSFMLTDPAFNVQQLMLNSSEAIQNTPGLVIDTSGASAPIAASALKGEPLDTGSITLTWTDNSHNELYFLIERKTTESDYDSIMAINFDETEYTDKGLISGIEYTYRIKAVGTIPTDVYSEITTVKTKKVPTGSPAIPTNLVAKSAGINFVNLSWIDNSDDEEYFILERQTNNEYVVVDTVEANTTCYSDIGVFPLTTYTYRIFASNIYFVSGPSNELTVSTDSTGKTYYIDQINGNDSFSGLSTDSAWKSIERANEQVFSAGDSVLLARGSVWTGMLSPKGSGLIGFPIYLGTYGEGNRPLIHAEGLNQAGLLLHNIEFWEVNGLEITNTNGTDTDQGALFGIYVLADEGEGIYDHVYINDCYVREINGHVEGKERGGIHVHIKNLNKSIFNDLRITNNKLKRIGGVGIGNTSSCGSIEFKTDSVVLHNLWTNVYVAFNHLDHTGRNSIIARVSKDAVYEYNIMAYSSRHSTGHSIFCFNTSGIKIQYNEAYGNTGEGGMDRGGFDADYNCVNTFIQYNYSHDNLWFCGIMKKVNRNVVIRYNISQNDHEGIYFYGFDNESKLENIHIYNNTHYVSAGHNVQVFPENRHPRNTIFENNIFYFEKAGSWGPYPQGENVVFNRNLYYNIKPHPGDTNAIIGNPGFIDPGSAGNGIETVMGYKINASSPAIDNGNVIGNNGGIDFWGDTLYRRKPDIGAHEFFEIPNTTSSTGVFEHKTQTDMHDLCIIPNPMVDNVTISFKLEKEKQILIEIFNIQGSKIKTLFNSNLKAGNQYIHWNGKCDIGHSLPNGLYICNLRLFGEVGSDVLTRSIIINR